MKTSLFISFLLFTVAAYAQTNKYLVLFKDKNGTPYNIAQPSQFLSKRAIERRTKQQISITTRDLPVSPNYVSSIRQTGAKVLYTSKWLNGALIEAPATTLNKLLLLPFVRGIDGNIALKQAQPLQIHSSKNTLGTVISTNNTTSVGINYGNSQTQIAMLGIDKMHKKGFNGQGIYIALFDGGFLNANKLEVFQPIITDNRLIATYDFVNHKTDVFDEEAHGTETWSVVGAYKEGQLIGTAYGASFVLCKTEDNTSESRVEEANWLVAAEYADSLGVDIISSSLGYNQFDNAHTDYTYKQLDGNTTIITRAADWAASVGIVVVNSAGNEGNKTWRYLTAPADADSILAVGSVDKFMNPSPFTSLGFSNNNRIKPDVATMGQSVVLAYPTGGFVTGQGTSFAAPAMAGLVAGFWQSNPQLTNMQVMDYIRKAGHLYNTPNVYSGYGVPDFGKANALVPPQDITQNTVVIFPNPNTDKKVSLHLLLDAKHEDEVFSVKLLDTIGNQLWQGETIGSKAIISFDSSQLPTGIYLLVLEGSTNKYVARWVKSI
jgi:serine protease AprX